MNKTILKFCLLSLLAVAIQGLPGKVSAQDNEKPSTERKETRKPNVTPFHGNLKAVDNAARTLSVGKLTLQTTADTRFMKAGKPATLQDAVVGEEVGGAYKKSDDGKLNATTVRFGPKTEGEGAKEKTK